MVKSIKQLKKNINDFIKIATQEELWEIGWSIETIKESRERRAKQAACSHPSFSYFGCGSHTTFYKCDICDYIKEE